MPKETIQFTGAVLREDGANVPHTSIFFPRLEVGWSKANVDNAHGNVSIRTAADVRTDSSAEADVDVRSVIGSRDEINRLIRTLRKARDQAFGADA